MRWVAAWALMMLVGLPALWARDDAKAEPKEPAKSKVAEEVDALIADYQKAVSDYNEKLKNAKTGEVRSKIYQAFPKPDETLDKLWDLVEKNPKDKEASLTALQWLQKAYYSNDDKSQKGRSRVLDMLIKGHADDPKIGPVLSYLSNMFYGAKAEELFRAVMAKNPARDAKGVACLELGKYLMSVSEGVQLLKAFPEEGKQMEAYLGKEAFMKLKDVDPDKLAKEAEAVFEEAAAKYGDVVLSSYIGHPTVGDQAAGELFVIRNLSIGKTAPDIVGDDLDGKPFKLSDYRGKVVVLDFWGNW